MSVISRSTSTLLRNRDHEDIGSSTQERELLHEGRRHRLLEPHGSSELGHLRRRVRVWIDRDIDVDGRDHREVARGSRQLLRYREKLQGLSRVGVKYG